MNDQTKKIYIILLITFHHSTIEKMVAKTLDLVSLTLSRTTLEGNKEHIIFLNPNIFEIRQEKISISTRIRIQIEFARSAAYPTRIRIHSSTQDCSGNIGNEAKHAS